MSVRRVIACVDELNMYVGRRCLNYPKRAEDIATLAAKIQAVYLENIELFNEAKENAWIGWDLPQMEDFLKTVKDLNALIDEMFSIVDASNNEKVLE